jgi:hypothetical protein
VTLGAEVKRENEVKDGKRALRSERYYGSVYRSFTLPAEVDESASEARYDKGVLELKLAKKTQPAGRKLNVPAARGGGGLLPRRRFPCTHAGECGVRVSAAASARHARIPTLRVGRPSDAAGSRRYRMRLAG